MVIKSLTESASRVEHQSHLILFIRLNPLIDGTTTKTDPAAATNPEHPYSTTTAADTGIYVFIGESGTQVMINR